MDPEPNGLTPNTKPQEAAVGSARHSFALQGDGSPARFETGAGYHPPQLEHPHLAVALQAALETKGESPDATIKRARSYAKFLAGGWMAKPVDAIHITNPGRGYASAPLVVFEVPPGVEKRDGYGADIAAQATVTNGEVTAVRVAHGGSGYVVAPLVKFDGGGGEGATAVAVLKEVE